jgi:phosphoglycerate dehydrogenase-like enzyme
MGKPVAIVDPHWRRLEEVFAPADLSRLADTCEIVWARNEPIPEDVLSAALPVASFLIAAQPAVTAATLARAPELKAVIEVSGAFPDTVDYAACAARGIEVLSCAPGFRNSVAEMAVGLMLAGARGIVGEHEAFRAGGEHWLEDHAGRDFTLYGARVGFVGLGSIAREIVRLLAPFAPRFEAFDPWVSNAAANELGVELVDLPNLMSNNRCVVVAAAPTRENRGLVGATELAQLPRGALLVLISRAHLVDFEALAAAVASGRIRAAVDVFPIEPMPPNDPVRTLPGIVLSPHRAAAVEGGRHLIGRMIVDDLAQLIAGKPPSSLQRASVAQVQAIAGIDASTDVARMAGRRLHHVPDMTVPK